MWRLAEQYFIAGQTADARATLETGFSLDPTVLDLYRVEATLALADKDYSLAQDRLNLYVAYRPDDANGWTLIGKAYLGLGQATTALNNLNKAIEIDSRAQEAFVARGETYLILANSAAARKDFDAALRLGATVDLRLRIGKAYYDVSDYDSAVAEFKRAAANAPNLFEPNYRLGLAQNKAEAYADGARSLTDALDQAITEAEKFDALYQRALAYNGAGESEKTIADLGDLLLLNVTDRDEDRAAAAKLFADLGGPQPGITNTPVPLATATP